MRTMQIEVFTFDELSDRAKGRARDYFRRDDCWSWAGEWWDSAQAFSKIAPVDISEADYDRGHVSCRWTDSDEVAELKGLRAWKWLHNNGWFDWARRNKAGECTMTGFCGDCDFADPITEYECNPRRVPDLRQVFYEAAQSWVYAARSDMEHSYSDEVIDEMIECNEYEFTADGELV